MEQESVVSRELKPVVHPWHLHRRLYNWVLRWAETPYGAWALFVLSFAESSFFPVPPDVLLAPLSLGNRKKWYLFALNCSVASVTGAMLGFVIGMFLWAGIGDFFHNRIPGFSRDQIVLTEGGDYLGLVDAREDIRITQIFPLKTELVYPVHFKTVNGEKMMLTEEQLAHCEYHTFSVISALYNQYDWQAVGIAGFTPLPFKVFTITAGIAEINFFIFCLAAALSRSLRFFLVAGLFGIFGEKIKPFIDKYFNLICLAVVILGIGGFLVLKLLH